MFQEPLNGTCLYEWADNPERAIVNTQRFGKFCIPSLVN